MGVLDRILVTPSNHRVHHAQNERYIDKNYGGMLILWDRMFGTFQDEADEEPVIFGVRKPLANWNPFWANLQVYDYLLFDALHTKRWRDKIGIWFRRTGWRPADVAERFPKTRTDLSSFDKFDPVIATPLKRYVLAQFGVAILATLGIGVLYAESGTTAVLVPCVMLWVHLYALGIINEGRSYAVRAELLRLLVVVPTGMFIMAMSWPADAAIPMAAATAAYLLVSVGALRLVLGSSDKSVLDQIVRAD